MKPRKVMLALFCSALIFGGLLGIYGCAPSTATLTASTGEVDSSTAAWTWSVESDCGACHAAENDSLHEASFGASSHADLPCITCHTDAEALGSAHEDAGADSKMPKKLKSTAVDEVTCQNSGCHSEGLEGLAEKTADSTILTDSKGTAVNPHEVPTMTDAHLDASLGCIDCHPMHKEQDAAQKCGSCHHMDVYECNTCHE